MSDQKKSIWQVAIALIVIVALAIGGILLTQYIPGLNSSQPRRTTDQSSGDPTGSGVQADNTTPLILGIPVSARFSLNGNLLYRFSFDGRAAQRIKVIAQRVSGSSPYSILVTNKDDDSTIDSYTGGHADAVSLTLTLPADQEYRVNISVDSADLDPNESSTVAMVVEDVLPDFDPNDPHNPDRALNIESWRYLLSIAFFLAD